MSMRQAKVCFKKASYVVYQPYPGLHLAYHARRFLVSARSNYQRIDIIDNEAYGRMLFLDGNVQHTQYDAKVFRDALCGEAKRRKIARIFVLGGGSGQTVISLLESTSVNQVTVVEIDPAVIKYCTQYVEGAKHAFSDPRVTVVIDDAFSFLHSTNEEFDSAIIDLTEEPFHIGKESKTLNQLYADIRKKCNGRCSQYVGSEVNLSYNPRFRRLLESAARKHLSKIQYESTFIPSFGAPHVIMHAGYS